MFLVEPTDAGKRLDHFLQDSLPGYSRSRVQDWIKAGRVRVTGHASPPKASIDWHHAPPELPTTRGSLQELQTTVASIALKLDKVPFDEIGHRLSQTLENGN